MYEIEKKKASFCWSGEAHKTSALTSHSHFLVLRDFCKAGHCESTVHTPGSECTSVSDH